MSLRPLGGQFGTMAKPAPARSVTRSVTVDRPAHEVHAFLSDASNWPRWCVINILAIEPSRHPGWWSISTPQGPAEIRIHADRLTGIIDHEFRDPDEPGEVAVVPARVVANGRGAEFSMTIFQPPELDDVEFERQLQLIATELGALKRVLEHSVA
jgi:hypothetical protein